MKRDIIWRIQHFFHNFIVHPLMPLAEYLDETKHYKLADVLFKLHDETTPDGDTHKQRYL